MSNDAYDKLVNKSVIKENYADKTHDELRTNYLIPCDTIDNFYYDTLFYLHLHFSLYLELLNFNVKNNFDISAFRTLWNNINIRLVSSSQASLTNSISSTGYKVTSFSVNNNGSGYSTVGTVGSTEGPPITFVSSSGISEIVGTTVIEYGLLDEIRSNFTVVLAAGQTTHDFQVGDSINFTAPSGTGTGTKTAAVGIIREITSGTISRIEMTTRGTGYSILSAPLVTSVTNGSTTRRSTLTFTTGHITGYILSAAPINSNRVYRSIGNFIVSSQTGVSRQAIVYPITTIDTIGFINGNEYVFNLSEFNTNYYNTLSYTNAERVNIINNRLPRIDGISYYSTNPSFITISVANNLFTRTNTNTIQSVSNYNNDRANKFNNILKTIFDQDVKDILGFLAYQVRYYNVIVLNTSIQRMIYKYYLNDNNISMSISGIFEPNNAKYSNLINITEHISNMKENLDLIKEDVKNVNNIFSETKADYPGKINKLQNNEKDYTKIQDALNNTAKNYNQYYNNYNKLKIYASSIIIFLIILIVATIVITVIPYFNANSKNTYYILILILLIILTVLFYNNFSHINLYEKFTTQGIEIKIFNSFTCTDANKVFYEPNSRNAAQNNAHRQNNYTIFNAISDKLTLYNNAYSNLNTQMSSGIYTSDNKAFEQDADSYLNAMYIEKKRKIDLFRIKRTSLTNLIEAIKQQIIYLFNIIFIICLLTIVLLIALLLYVNMPQAMGLIITLVSLAIFFIVIYYIYAVVQPTRLIANKNYWANKNPSQETYNKL
jgi:hypothetical protein